MKNKIIFILLVSTIFLSSSVYAAKKNAKWHRNKMTITKISGNNITAVVKRKTYSLNTSGAHLYNAKNKTIIYRQLMVGDRVNVSGSIGQSGSLIVKKLKDLSLKRKETVRRLAIFSDDFKRSEAIKEGLIDRSTSPNWWVNSGAYLYVDNGIAKTVQGELAENDERRISYANNNPSETDNGYHPQNIFRLVTRSKWMNYEQQCYFKINKYILSADSHRTESNGLLLFNRYQDEDNLYYTGIRVDGTVVIKKKINQVYYTMAKKQVYGGNFDRNNNPNLLPLNIWLGVKTIVKNNSNGTISIKLFIDKNNSGNWELALEAIDDNTSYGGRAITESNYTGIRTDFMDVEFKNYRIEEE